MSERVSMFSIQNLLDRKPLLTIYTDQIVFYLLLIFKWFAMLTTRPVTEFTADNKNKCVEQQLQTEQT